MRREYKQVGRRKKPYKLRGPSGTQLISRHQGLQARPTMNRIVSGCTKVRCTTKQTLVAICLRSEIASMALGDLTYISRIRP